jgi:hypothetical protein
MAVDLKGNLVELTPGVRGVFKDTPVWTEGGGESPRHLKLRVVRK